MIEISPLAAATNLIVHSRECCARDPKLDHYGVNLCHHGPSDVTKEKSRKNFEAEEPRNKNCEQALTLPPLPLPI